MAELGLTFSGIHSQDMPIVINTITRPFSMNSSELVQEVQGMNGNVWMGNHNSSISFTIDITVIGDTRAERINNTRTIANWLFQIDNFDEQEMIFDEEPDKTYYGHFVGSSNITDLVDWGSTSLTFTCADPFAYKEQVDTDVFTSSPATLDVASQVATKPIINVQVNSDITSLALTNSNNDYIYLGNPTDDDQSQTTVNPDQNVFNDPMTNTTTWAANTSTNYINGVVAGQYECNNYALFTGSADYGTGTGWHGPSLKEFIPSSQQLQDFKVDAWVSFKSNNDASEGVCRIYLIDANNNSLGYICLKDNSGDPFTIFQCKAGTESNGHDVCYTGQNHWGIEKKVSYKKKVNGKWRWFSRWVYSGHMENKFNDFYGVLEVKRIGNVWTATIIGMNKVQQPQYRYTYSWTDKTNAYTSPKLAGVAIYNASYGTKPVMDSANAITNVSIYQENTSGWENANQIPVIASSGDEIMIDCEAHNILKNGDSMMDQLLIGSTFFDIAAGTEVIGYSPADKVNIALSYRPKYM